MKLRKVGLGGREGWKNTKLSIPLDNSVRKVERRGRLDGFILMLLIEAAISEAKREHNTTIFSELSPDFAFQSEASRHPSSSQTEDALI